MIETPNYPKMAENKCYGFPGALGDWLCVHGGPQRSPFAFHNIIDPAQQSRPTRRLVLACLAMMRHRSVLRMKLDFDAIT